MASAAQIAANRANAQKSTGPKTEEGKASSAENSFKHGFFAKAFVLADHEQQDFDELLTLLENQLKPGDVIASSLFSQILHAAWNLHRLRQLESQIYAQFPDPFSNDDATRRLDLIARHRARFERSHRSLLKQYRDHATSIETMFDLPWEIRTTRPYPLDVHRLHKSGREFRHAYTWESLLTPESRKKEQEERARRKRRHMPTQYPNAAA